MVKKALPSSHGFTLIELVVVIVILGILAATAAPKFLNLSDSAKVATLSSIKGTMQSTIKLVQAKAHIQGLVATSTNPGSGQSAYIIDYGNSSSEIDFRNLCPESQAELGSAMTMLDFLDLDLTSNLSAQTNNQYTLIGYDIPGFSVPTNQGCYIIYDSFGDPECTVTVVDVDC